MCKIVLMVNIRSALPLGSAKKVDSALSNLLQAPMSSTLKCTAKVYILYVIQKYFIRLFH